MFSKKVTINLEHKDDIIDLEPLSDIHIGHVGFDESLYKKRISAIARDPNRYTIFLGDQLDAITAYDKRFNPDTSVEHDIDNQRKIWQKLSKPLLDKHKSGFKYDSEEEVYNKLKSKNEKIWGLLHGNHEYKIPAITRPYLENTMSNPNALTFLGSRAMIGLEILYNDKVLSQWNILAIHGSGGGKPERMFEQMKKNHYCDVFICGHLHQKRYQPEIAFDFDWDTNMAWERDIHLANAGTFCHTLTNNTDGYMDRKNDIVPSQPGTVTLSFDAYQGKIVGHI